MTESAKQGYRPLKGGDFVYFSGHRFSVVGAFIRCDNGRGGEGLTSYTPEEHPNVSETDIYYFLKDLEMNIEHLLAIPASEVSPIKPS